MSATSNSRTITLKSVLLAIQDPEAVFSLGFRTLDGNYSFKARTKKNPGKAYHPAEGDGSKKKKDFSSVKRNMTKEGALMLYDCAERHPYEAKIELLVEFNGYRIFHNY